MQTSRGQGRRRQWALGGLRWQSAVEMINTSGWETRWERERRTFFPRVEIAQPASEPAAPVAESTSVPGIAAGTAVPSGALTMAVSGYIME